MTSARRRIGGVLLLVAVAIVAMLAGRSGPDTFWKLYYRSLDRIQPVSSWQQEITERGALRVALRMRALAVAPGAPYAEVPEAYDLALAQYLAGRLDVRLEIIDLKPAEQATALTTARVDIVLAGAAPDVSVRADPGPLDRTATSYLEGQGRLLVLPLAGQRPEQRADLAAHSICVDDSGPYRSVVERAAGSSRVQVFPSALVAISAFIANQCDALVEDGELLERLMTLDAMKYYELTPAVIDGNAPAPVRVAATSPAARSELDSLLHIWKRTGAARRASQGRAAEMLIEVAQLQGGYSCH